MARGKCRRCGWHICECGMSMADAMRMGLVSTGATSHAGGPKFDGYDARVDRSGGTINVYYGGRHGNTPNDGHGHVKATGGPRGESIVFWRLPESEGGQVIVSNQWDLMYGNDLANHLSGD